MKNLISYAFPPLLVCAYVAVTMGFALHVCAAEGSSKLLLMTGESPCHHQHTGDHEEDHDHKDCGCDEHDDRCCHTLVYILDEAQNVMDYVKINVPDAWNTISLRASKDIPVLYGSALPVLYTADIVRGPDGGLTSITPLRL
ncbi:MAG: hypothetical protein FWE99_05055 [Bacteroidales bacterium]|nr:hypothetical protein [Bacteroidales bacterium]